MCTVGTCFSPRDARREKSDSSGRAQLGRFVSSVKLHSDEEGTSVRYNTCVAGQAPAPVCGLGSPDRPDTHFPA